MRPLRAVVLVCPHCRLSSPSAQLDVAQLARCSRDGFALVARSALDKSDGDPFLGVTLDGGFVPLELASTGSTSAVYEGRAEDGSRAALKVLRLDGPPGEAAVSDAWRREVDALRMLESRFVVRMLSSGRFENPPALFIALEWLDGELLSDRPRLPEPGPAAAVEIATRITSGLNAIHDLGLVHGDLKPSNVMLVRSQGATLFDLGSATRSGTRAPAVTPSVASPEHLSGAPVDGRADLYALGCLLYGLLTGAPPFSGSQDVVRRGHLELRPPAPSSRGASSNATLDALVLALLEKRREDRPESASRVLVELAASTRLIG